MSISENNLVWLDMEMTGLNPDSERIIELAIVVTNSQLDTLAEAPIWVIHQPDEVLNAMDSWNTNMHGKTGLTEKVKLSRLDESAAEAQALEFLKQWVPPGKSPLCGNTISQDRRFMVRYMPKLEEFFHYRNLDVSTLKELCRRWRPEIYRGLKKNSAHQALADVYESINELKYYREHFFKLN